jgi:hypothetical protein
VVRELRARAPRWQSGPEVREEPSSSQVREPYRVARPGGESAGPVGAEDADPGETRARPAPRGEPAHGEEVELARRGKEEAAQEEGRRWWHGGGGGALALAADDEAPRTSGPLGEARDDDPADVDEEKRLRRLEPGILLAPDAAASPDSRPNYR